jgi:adenine-specific DNA-methyltransferase
VPNDARESGLEFLGNKTALASIILATVESVAGRRAKVADVFCGTASVSANLRSRGHVVHANDHLALCATWARSRLLAPMRPLFIGLRDVIDLEIADPYKSALDYLNRVTPIEGFITRHYTPVSREVDGVERRYLSVRNGMAVDAAREHIRSWQPLLTVAEEALLLHSLVAGVISVSNIAGTYGCFLREWKPRATRPMVLLPYLPQGGSHLGHRVTSVDAAQAVSETDADVIYADPPYTKRQYAAYYHLLETVVIGDEPSLVGSTGLRPWRSRASDWCYSRRAPDALERLVAKSSAPRLILSYNDDGQIPHEVVLEILSSYGSVRVLEVQRRRYKSSQLPHKGGFVIERLYCLER